MFDVVPYRNLVLNDTVREIVLVTIAEPYEDCSARLVDMQDGPLLPSPLMLCFRPVAPSWFPPVVSLSEGTTKDPFI